MRPLVELEERVVVGGVDAVSDLAVDRAGGLVLVLNLKRVVGLGLLRVVGAVFERRLGVCRDAGERRNVDAGGAAHGYRAARRLDYLYVLDAVDVDAHCPEHDHQQGDERDGYGG